MSRTRLRPWISRQEGALERFERLTAWPMLVLSLAIVPLLVTPLVVELSPATETTLFTLDWIIWAVFALEYGIRLYLAPNRWQFIRRNVVDLAVVLIPFLRPLRMGRSFRLLRALRATQALLFLTRGARAGRIVLTRHKLHYALLVSALAVIGGGLLVVSVEKGAAEANIKSVGEAVWWAVTTVTTVGYGDRFPVTPVGRGVAVVLMVLGIGLFGLLAASLASFFIAEREEDESKAQLAEINDRLERIEALLVQTPTEGSARSASESESSTLRR
jgi:voltage-gated potassium channel